MLKIKLKKGKKNSIKISLILWLLVIIYATFIFQLSSAPIEKQPATIQETESFVNTTINQVSKSAGNKINTEKNLPDIEHSILYLGFGSLLYFAVYSIKYLRKKRTSALFAGLIGFFYGISDETHQYFISGRDASINDVLFDGLGIIIGVFIAIGFCWILKNKLINIKFNS